MLAWGGVFVKTWTAFGMRTGVTFRFYLCSAMDLRGRLLFLHWDAEISISNKKTNTN